MNFRSTNPEGYVHFGGDVMSGAQSTRGVLLSSNTVSPVSDNSNEDLILRGKGTGGVIVGASTTPLNFVSGLSTTTIPNMPGASQAVSTMAAPGVSTGDMVLCADPRNSLSTHVTLSRAYPSAADEITLVWINVHASSIAAESTGTAIRWTYLDRT